MAGAKTNGQHSGVQPKVVGPNVQGNLEEYQLVRRLQSALFGGVYEAKGMSSGKDFAIKVLHKSELSKAEGSDSIEFCEVPLSEIRFADLMRGDEHVMETTEHFEDTYCFYVVFELARGGDLLEALKQKPHGFDELQAQNFILQAAQGLAFLHKRRVAMQDVSLENLLLNIDQATGHYQVKVCDPGQAVVFELDQNGEELPVNFRGLVGKSFRPPELHEQQPYYSTKVDSWCLGWSTFYLLTAQPLFMSADPAQQDADWLLFQQGDLTTLFQQKSNLCSPTGLDFIFRLLQIEPHLRMSVTDALSHPWLTDPKIVPVLASKDLLPEHILKAMLRRDREEIDKNGKSPSVSAAGSDSTRLQLGSSKRHRSGTSPVGSIAWSSASELPTWAAARTNGASTLSPTSRARSPPRSTRVSGGAAPRMLSGRRRPIAPTQGRQYVIATAHSPAPGVASSPRADPRGNLGSATRTASPLGGPPLPTTLLRSSPIQYVRPPVDATGYYYDSSAASFLTPRSATRPLLTDSMGGIQEDTVRGRAWAFRADGSNELPSELTGRQRALSPVALSPGQPVHGAVSPLGWAHGRVSHSPARAPAHVHRSLSPAQYQQASRSMRSHSPGAPLPRAPEGVGFSWAQAPAMISPRSASPRGGTAMTRTASPLGHTFNPGRAWLADPPSPRVSPRSFSPAPAGFQELTAQSSVPRWRVMP